MQRIYGTDFLWREGIRFREAGLLGHSPRLSDLRFPVNDLREHVAQRQGLGTKQGATRKIVFQERKFVDPCRSTSKLGGLDSLVNW